MKPNQYRIGNYVHLKHCDYDFEEPRKVISIFRPNLVTLEKISLNRITYNNIYPIPLTEWWLKEFGFEKGIHDSDMRIQITKKCSMLVWTCDKNDNCLIGNDLILTINYVHELQNLYFELTGKELKTTNQNT